MPRIIVERSFTTPLTADELHAVEARMAPCLALYGVDWIRSYWSADRHRMICEYDAPDLASVRAVQREAGAAFDRAWPADLLAPDPPRRRLAAVVIPAKGRQTIADRE